MLCLFGQDVEIQFLIEYLHYVVTCATIDTLHFFITAWCTRLVRPDLDGIPWNVLATIAFVEVIPGLIGEEEEILITLERCLDLNVVNILIFKPGNILNAQCFNLILIIHRAWM